MLQPGRGPEHQTKERQQRQENKASHAANLPYPRAGVCAVPGAWRKPRNRRFLTRAARESNRRPRSGGLIFAQSFFELSRRWTLAIFPESGQGFLTVLVTPKLGGNATDIRRFFMPFFRSQDCFCLLFPAIKVSVAGCCRYVQAARLKAASRSELRLRTPGIAIRRRCQLSNSEFAP